MFDLVLGRVADLSHRLGFQHAQQLALRLHAEVPHFVEKEGAFVGDLEQPLLRGDRPGERSLDVAEQLAFQQRRRQGRAIAGQQGPIFAGTEAVEGAHHHLLAGAALAGDQDGPLAGRDALDDRKDVLHRPAFADDPLEALVDLQFAPQENVFAHQRGSLPDFAEDQLELIGRERLAEVVGGALLHCFDGRIHGGMAGDDDHLGGDAGGLDFSEDLQPVHARHLQVQEDQVEVAGEGRLQAGLGVLAALHLVPVRGENPLTGYADHAIVVDQQIRCPTGHPFSAGSSAQGRTTVNTLPLPSWLSTSSAPPCSWMMP